MIIYFGGKFPFKYKDFSIDNLKKDYRAELIDIDMLLHEPANHPNVKGTDNTYAGPFYFYETGESAEEVVKREALAVVNADVCYFLLDNDAAVPGTVTEIINATLHKKIIRIFYVSDKIDDGEPERTISSPLWYPILFSLNNKDNVFIKGFKTFDEAKEALLKDVRSI